MKRFRLISILMTVLLVASVFAPYSAVPAYADDTTTLTLNPVQEFTLPMDDPEYDIDYLTCHLGDVLTVTYGDNTSVDFVCTDDEYWEFTSERDQTITLGVYGWNEQYDEFKVGETYDAYVIVTDTGGVAGVTQYQPLKPPVSVTIVDAEPAVFIENIDLTLSSGQGLQLMETEDGAYDDININCHEGDTLVVSYSDGSTETLTADEDGDFYSRKNQDWIPVYFQWVRAEGVEFDDDGNLSGKAGETYDAYVFAYKRINVNTSGEEIFAKDADNEYVTFPVTIVGYDWEIHYDWAEDYSSVTATATREDDEGQTITRTETVNTTAAITKYPDDTPGETTYTATFTKTPFEIQTKTIANIPVRDLVVTGGTEGTDYTYTGGVLTFLKNGTYSVRMGNEVDETSDRIVIDAHGTTVPGTGAPIDPDFSQINLTLDGVSISTTGNGVHALTMDSRFRESCFGFNLVLKGENTFASDKSPWYSGDNPGNSMLWDLTIDADSGTTADTLELIDRGNGQFDLSNFTLNTGKFKLASGEFGANKVITINDGEFVVNSSTDDGAVFCNQAFIMNGGKADVTNSGSDSDPFVGSRCIHVLGNEADAVDGVVINGGDLKLTSEGTLGGATITTGDRNRKNVIINTDGTVTINTNNLGIWTANGGDVIMKKGLLKINGGKTGIDLSSRSGKLFIEGGETEIQSGKAMDLSNADKKVNFADSYVHKNYDGDSKENREEAEDANLLNNGVSAAYVLITPAYPIEYNLDGGALGEDVTNPEVYSRVDSFTLNNPAKEGHDFTGWTGTGLEGPTATVGITATEYPAEGIGPLSYTATYTPKKFTVTWKNYNGSVLETDENVDYGTMPVYNGNTPEKPADDSYIYNFTGWDPEVTTVKGDTVYTAKFQPVKKTSATVTFHVVNGNWNNGKSDDISLVYRAVEGVLMELKASDIPGAGEKPEEGYEAGSWDTVPRAQALSDGTELQFTYTYTPKKFNIAFYDEDGTSVLKAGKEYSYGTPKADIEVPEDPSKQEDAVYTYAFTGWDPELADVTGAVNYKAVYEAAEKEITIRYAQPSEGGSIYPDSETVKVSSGTPQGCSASAAPGYEFVGWTDEEGNIVSTSPHFVPQKDEESGLYASTVYTPTFKKSSSGGGGGGGGGGGQVDPPVVKLNDHIAYIAGYPDGTVKPNGNVTRAETATIIWRLMTDEERDEILTAENDFSDMTEDLWYNKAVSSLVKGGYITGYPDGTFKGGNQITRAEFVTIMSRLMGVKSGSSDFSDVDGHWAADYIGAAAEQGWVNGYEDGTFRPDNPMTRAEVMAVMNRIRERGVDETSSLGVYSLVKTFGDNSDSEAWHYYEVLEATNDHQTAGKRPDEDWAENKTDIVYDKDKYETPGK